MRCASISPGGVGDVAQARDPVEAIRLRANRLKVWRKGKLLTETQEVVAKLAIDGRPNALRFSLLSQSRP